MGEREQQQRERRASLVVEPPEQAEVEQREPAVVGEQDVPAMRVGVVDARLRDLPDIGAEKVGGELLGPVGREPVVEVQLAAVDPLEHEHALGHVRMDHLRHDEVVVVLQLLRDQLGVVRLLDEVELGP